jgi:hypothetical protein
LKADPKDQDPGKIAAHVKKISIGEIKGLGHTVDQGHAHGHEGVYGTGGQTGDNHVGEFIK